MVQPVKKTVKKQVKKTPKKKGTKGKRKHPEYGTSKLEDRFASNFLDKLSVKYTRQFKAESIGRYYDFYLPEENIILEIDGDYYHSYGKLHEEKNPMQKHNERVDKIKDHWALINGFKLLRIWEHDINNHPTKVMNMLKKELTVGREKMNKENEMKKRH